MEKALIAQGGLITISDGLVPVQFRSSAEFERYAGASDVAAALRGKTYLCYMPDSKLHIDQAANINKWVEPVDEYDAIIAMASQLAAAKADPYWGLSADEKAARRLAAAKSAKRDELAQSFAAAEIAPIEIGGHLYKGGSSSAMALDGQRRMMMEYAALMPELGITTVDFYDVYGNPVTLPIKDNMDIDALDVCLAVGTAASAVSFKYAPLARRLELAETVEEVEAIIWS